MRLTDAQMIESRVLVEVDIALKAQMERVITDLTKILNQPTDRYIRLKDCYKYVEQLKTKLDKTELLEGENERD